VVGCNQRILATCLCRHKPTNQREYRHSLRSAPRIPSDSFPGIIPRKLGSPCILMQSVSSCTRRFVSLSFSFLLLFVVSVSLSSYSRQEGYPVGNTVRKIGDTTYVGLTNAMKYTNNVILPVLVLVACTNRDLVWTSKKNLSFKIDEITIKNKF
jgi:hypothetical protein